MERKKYRMKKDKWGNEERKKKNMERKREWGIKEERKGWTFFFCSTMLS